MNTVSQSSIYGKTALAIVLAVVVWTVIHLLLYFLISALDFLRGTSDDILQSLFRTLFPSGVGGYFGIHAIKQWIPKANFRFALMGFSILVFLIMIALPIGMHFQIQDAQDFFWKNQVTGWLEGLAGILGAWIAYRRIAC